MHCRDWGPGQLSLLLASSSSWITLSLLVLSMVFVTEKPKWDCLSTTDSICQTLLQKQGDFCDLSPAQYRWTDPHTSLVSYFDLVCEDSWKVGLSNSVFFLGYLVGSSLFGWMADKKGRKSCLLLSNLTSAVASVLCGLSPRYWWYVAARTAVGFCCSGLPVAAYVLATEAVGPSHRGRAGTYSQVMYHIGQWFLPVLAFWLQDWRHLNWAIAGWCLVTAVMILPYPESPRWLLLNGQEQQARTALVWLAGMNGRQLPDAVMFSAAASSTVADLEAATLASGIIVEDLTTKLCSLTASRGGDLDRGDAVGSVALLADQSLATKGRFKLQARPTAAAKPSGHYDEGVVVVLQHPLLLRYFLVTLLLCLAMATTFYLANLATDDLGGPLYVNFLLTSVGELPAALVAAVAVDRVGREVTIATGLWLTGFACGICSLLPSGWWTIALASVGKAACSGTWTVAYIAVSELFPTSVRSAALAGTNQASRLGGVLAPAVIYISQQLHLPAVPFAVAGAVSLLTGALLKRLPETMGREQPETTQDLERMYGQQAADSKRSGQSWLPQAWNRIARQTRPQPTDVSRPKVQCGQRLQSSLVPAATWTIRRGCHPCTQYRHDWQAVDSEGDHDNAQQEPYSRVCTAEDAETDMEVDTLLPCRGG